MSTLGYPCTGLEDLQLSTSQVQVVLVVRAATVIALVLIDEAAQALLELLDAQVVVLIIVLGVVLVRAVVARREQDGLDDMDDAVLAISSLALELHIAVFV